MFYETYNPMVTSVHFGRKLNLKHFESPDSALASTLRQSINDPVQDAYGDVFFIKKLPILLKWISWCAVRNDIADACLDVKLEFQKGTHNIGRRLIYVEDGVNLAIPTIQKQYQHKNGDSLMITSKLIKVISPEKPQDVAFVLEPVISQNRTV